MNRIRLSILLISATCFVSCEDDSGQVIPAEEAPSLKSQNSSDQWMEGGEYLDEGKIMDWRNAASDDKMATAAKYLQKSDSVPSEDLMHEHAEALVTCINESVDGMMTMTDDPIVEVAASCLSSMGFLKENEPEKLRN